MQPEQARAHVRIGVIGGTGPAGSGLAARLSAAGHSVILGSRDPRRSADCVTDLQRRWGPRVGDLTAGTNEQSAAADVVVLATVAESLVSAAGEHAERVGDRVLVCMGNTLARSSRGFAAVVPHEGSLAAAVQRVAPKARVVGAFQNLPAKALLALHRPVHAHVVVCGDDADAVRVVRGLASTIDGVTAVDGGPLANSMAIEALTAVLLTVNRASRAEYGIRLVDLGAEPMDSTAGLPQTSVR